jgi:hypothetical protein
LEGTYLEIIADRKVMLTWYGIEGLRSGQSMVAFALNADGNDIVVRLRHSGLSTPAVAATGGGIASLSHNRHRPYFASSPRFISPIDARSLPRIG